MNEDIILFTQLYDKLKELKVSSLKLSTSFSTWEGILFTLTSNDNLISCQWANSETADVFINRTLTTIDVSQN